MRVQLPFAASDESEPEPDVAVVARGDYLDGHPRQAFLVVEVARTSADEDRRIKGALYASAGVPEYWLVNLAEHVVEVFREPAVGAYRQATRHGREATRDAASSPTRLLRAGMSEFGSLASAFTQTARPPLLAHLPH